MNDLSFQELREASEIRNSENAGGESDWTLADWGNALAGETGELCNFIKKARRTLPTDPSLEDLKDKMAHELADIVTYADLIAGKLGVDLGEAVREKFNIVSKRRNSPVTL
jgi:NTP pyrophosphatase (non-canonical NTP hydrolase)